MTADQRVNQRPQDRRLSPQGQVERAAAIPGATVDGVLVCEQVTGGVETVIGLVEDPLFGPTVMFGIGGTAVEVYRDVAFRVAPFSRDDALAMIKK